MGFLYGVLRMRAWKDRLMGEWQLLACFMHCSSTKSKSSTETQEQLHVQLQDVHADGRKPRVAGLGMGWSGTGTTVAERKGFIIAF
jgi:hypothetical protein